MPLIINGTSIDYLNGPVSFVYLKPPKGSSLNYNILLLGDTHTTENYVPCARTPDVNNCVETYQLVELLNEFGREHRVDFYMEYMAYDEKRRLVLRPDLIHNEGFIERKKATIRTRQDTLKNYFVDPRSPNTERAFQQTKGKANWSDMLYLFNSLESCYYKDVYKTQLCPFKNIYWHFSDLRKVMRIELFENVKVELSNLFINIQKKKLTIDDFVDFIWYFTEIQHLTNDEIKEFFRMFKEILQNNIELYIDSLFNPRSSFFLAPLRKQYEKILPEMSRIITMESFYQIARVSMEKTRFSEIPLDLINPGMNQEHLASIIEILNDLIDIPDEIYQKINTLSQTDKDYLTRLFGKFHQLDITDRGIKLLPAIALHAEIVIPDIYFIMRIFKRESTKLNRNKLIVHYIGSNHHISIKRYLTRFCGYTVNYERDMIPGIRRIPIDRTININLLFPHFPERKSRKQKSLSVGKRKSRKTHRRTRSL
jgi:hypothetical protein